ncbi:ester cyclase [Halostella sp. PRR32]|uniref:ester cyclase n=1 Tax=Halostella sp. PRR32 TaxID=3098147 RepID=UPI002B1D88EF|nr:ester cyclase [Halostella sp. PRR32]
MAQATPDAEQIVTAYVAMWNDRDYAKIPELVSESFVMYDTNAPADDIPGPAGEVHGPDGLEAWIRAITTAFPDFEADIQEMLASDDRVMYEVTLSGTHEGEFAGIPPTGREIELSGMESYRVADGAVQEHRTYYDRQEFLNQLGLTDDAT